MNQIHVSPCPSDELLNHIRRKDMCMDDERNPAMGFGGADT